MAVRKHFVSTHTLNFVNIVKATAQPKTFPASHAVTHANEGGPARHVAIPFNIQAKLTVGQEDDPLEHEADAMADTVMRMPVNSFIQRKCAGCGEEEKVQKKAVNGITAVSQSQSDKGATVNPSTAEAIKSSAGSGNRMDAETNSFMSNRFGSNFSEIKIHTDSESINLNRDLNARAFTVGRDIYFNEGEYQPASAQGKKLLAHELTHTIQQGRGAVGQVQRTPAEELAARRRTIISNARARAFHRVNIAYLRINGTSPSFNQTEEMARIHGMIAPDIVNFEQIVEIVGSIMNRLGSDSNIEIGPEITQCTGEMGWVGYVTGNRLPIHLCTRFFKSTPEEQVRTLIHEAAHAAGIGEPGAESYFALYDCGFGTSDNWLVADAWSRYIHCLSGQTPD